jgi:hypothetical protein
MRYSVLCRIHYRYLIVGIYYCYRYLRVHWVQKGPVHPLLELPQADVPVVDVQAHSVQSIQVSIYNTV